MSARRGARRDDDGGHELAGYRLIKSLGEGGMGEVWLGEITGPGGATKQHALKRILPGHADKPDRVARFLDEMKLAATLEHPNIVSVIRFGEEDGSYFLVMELVRGFDLKSLASRLRELALRSRPRYPGQEQGLLPPAVVVSVFQQAAEALYYAHHLHRVDGGTGVVHRDISRCNILVDRWGVARINDWGIGKALQDERAVASSTDHAYGKLLYMPPEQAGGHELDARADLYAFGIAFFEALTGGRHPYADPSRPHEEPMAVFMRAVKAERGPDMTELVPELPPRLQALLSALIQPDPQQRVPSADAVASACNDILRDLGTDAHAAKRLTSELVRLVYERPDTRPEMPGMGSHDESEPSRSEKRLIASSATGSSTGSSTARTAAEPKPVARTAELDVAPAPDPAYPATALLPQVHATAPLAPPLPSTPEPSAPASASRRLRLAFYAALATLALLLGTTATLFVMGKLGPSRATPPPRQAPAPASPPAPAAGPAAPSSPGPSTSSAPSVPQSTVPTTPAEPAPSGPDAPPPASPAVELGTLTVIVQPFGDVWIQGRHAGSRRVTRRLPAGDYTVGGGRLGRPTQTRLVHVSANETTTVRLQL
ncbi:MAG: serine/threonine protein kinase [Sandaracinaceae bacterium]|nr:serine/threonine protein kinase [Sandaracinaceae bacterium]